jgi:hypothetical protein
LRGLLTTKAAPKISTMKDGCGVCNSWGG